MMDELNSNFGRLSTGAAEWKPKNSTPVQHQYQQQQQQRQKQQYTETDLNPKLVKEFVPGQGWSSQASTGEKRQYERISSLFTEYHRLFVPYA